MKKDRTGKAIKKDIATFLRANMDPTFNFYGDGKFEYYGKGEMQVKCEAMAEIIMKLCKVPTK